MAKTGEIPEARKLGPGWSWQVAFLGLVGGAEIWNPVWFKTWSLTWLSAAPACPELEHVTGSLRAATWARPVDSCCPALPMMHVRLCWRHSALLLSTLSWWGCHRLPFPVPLLCPCPHPWGSAGESKMSLRQDPPCL